MNLSGAFLLGALLTLLLERLPRSRIARPQHLRVVTAGGFLGAYTTFSTFAYETLRLIEEGARTQALLNAVSGIGAGLAAATTGWALAVTGQG